MLTLAWSWITNNAEALAVVVAAVPLLWAVFQFIYIRRAAARRERFETYHSLIKQLVEQEDPNTPMRLDRQIAVIYELREFKHYFPVTLRILKGLREDWAGHAPETKRNRLHEEIDLAIAFIEQKI